MSGDFKILLTTLWQRTSERGNEYLSGFLGKARIIGFRGEPTADGTPTWDLYLTPGKEQEEARVERHLRKPAPTSMSRTGVERWRGPQPGPDDEGPALPLNDDISDVGGEQ